MSQHRHSNHHRRTSPFRMIRNGITNTVQFILSILEDFFRGKGAKPAEELGVKLSFEKKD
ncbi:MAG: hypothetical protein QG665_106 [Patescibacteria group bacterium]|nr:hypothetical protein [Patescibacteria group bacterium]